MQQNSLEEASGLIECSPFRQIRDVMFLWFVVQAGESCSNCATTYSVCDIVQHLSAEAGVFLAFLINGFVLLRQGLLYVQ